MKIALTAATLLLIPGLAAAQCSGYGQKAEDVTMSCVAGTVMDAETNTCVPQTNT